MRSIIVVIAAALISHAALASGPARTEFNMYSSATQQAQGIQVGTKFGCSTAEFVAGILHQPTQQKALEIFQAAQEVGVCIDFDKLVPVQAMRPLILVHTKWAGDQVVWLLRVVFKDGTSADFYWSVDRATSDKWAKEIGDFGA